MKNSEMNTRNGTGKLEGLEKTGAVATPSVITNAGYHRELIFINDLFMSWQ